MSRFPSRTIRNAVSIGGDSDTIAAIAGSIAEAYWGVPKDLAEKAETYLEPEMLQVLRRFQSLYQYFDAKRKCTP